MEIVRRTWIVILLASGLWVCVAGTGCARDAIVFGTSTRFGIELNTTEAGQQGARVGYKRAEGVTMPTRYREVTTTPDGGKKKGDWKLRDKAFPVFAAFRFDTGSLLLAGLGTTEVEQRFATGQAAVSATSTAEGIQAMLSAGFVSTGLSECLAVWNGRDPANTTRLGEWMRDNGLPEEPTMFIYSDMVTDEARQQAIDALDIDCDGN
jgi:hypothetical protein